MSKTSLRSLAIGSKPAEPETPNPQAGEKPDAAARGKSKNDKPMSLRVPKPLWRDLQLRRIDEDRFINDIIIDAIEQYLRRAGGPSSR